MADEIKVRVLGDFGPFSMMGKSIGYEVTIGDSIYLLDCGAPLFQQIGSPNLKNIKGIIITHCHDDHKRWFTDLALFHRYEPKAGFKINLLTSEEVQSELLKSSRTALDRSLSEDSKLIVDIPKDEYVSYQMIGPRAKYRITSKGEGRGKTGFSILDLNDNIPGPDVAKVVISRKTGRPRMLFKDPHYQEWVEPESFYPFSSQVFYEENRNVYESGEGFTIEAIKSPVWHGIPNIGIKIKKGKETLVFSSDTVHNTELWEALWREKRVQNLEMPVKEYEDASFLYGDINDYTERTWSEERYNEAVNAFNDGIIMHDVSCRNSTVHTDYEKLNKTVLEKDRTILTHGPDRLVSEWAVCFTEKIFTIKNNSYYEEVDKSLYPLNADIYCKDGEQFFVGYKNEHGKYLVRENKGLLSLSREGDNGSGTPLYRVDLYEDISGKYFPRTEDEHLCYRERRDGQVELVEFSESGSQGRIAEDQRPRLSAGTGIIKPEKQSIS